MAHIFEKTTVINRPLSEVFEFFSKAENLEKLTPSFLNFKILTPQPIAMYAGTLIDYQIKLNGIPFKWRTKITHWEPPYKFRDEQLKGPYKQWIHTHTFEEKDGKTHMTDRIEYLSPGWFLEPLIDKLYIRGNVEKIFNHRELVLDEIFG
ncbi:MAG: hypothetical protein RLZZ175_24 [Bacteroidota bacterium]|jgi:ligand-binding SRPBCC domain-containing protein